MLERKEKTLGKSKHSFSSLCFMQCCIVSEIRFFGGFFCLMTEMEKFKLLLKVIKMNICKVGNLGLNSCFWAFNEILQFHFGGWMVKGSQETKPNFKVHIILLLLGLFIFSFFFSFLF